MTSVGATTGSALVDGVDVDAVATAVRGCKGVDDLYSSSSETVASYLPGRQVAGIRVTDTVVTIQVRSVWAVPFEEVAAQIRAAAGPLCAGRQIDVVFGDIADPVTAPPAPPVVGPAVASAPVSAPSSGAPTPVAEPPTTHVPRTTHVPPTSTPPAPQPTPAVAPPAPHAVEVTQPPEPTFGPAFAPPAPPVIGPAAVPPAPAPGSASKP